MHCNVITGLVNCCTLLSSALPWAHFIRHAQTRRGPDSTAFHSHRLVRSEPAVLDWDSEGVIGRAGTASKRLVSVLRTLPAALPTMIIWSPLSTLSLTASGASPPRCPIPARAPTRAIPPPPRSLSPFSSSSCPPYLEFRCGMEDEDCRTLCGAQGVPCDNQPSRGGRCRATPLADPSVRV